MRLKRAALLTVTLDRVTMEMGMSNDGSSLYKPHDVLSTIHQQVSDAGSTADWIAQVCVRLPRLVSSLLLRTSHNRAAALVRL